MDDPGDGLDITMLFDVEELQRIQDAFAQAMGVGSIITRPDGTPITRPSNFCRFCRDIIRQTDTGRRNCHASDALIGSCLPTGPTVRRCLSAGLWDAGASITVGGRHVASWLAGQVRDAHQDDEEALRYADAIGADREEYRRALSEVTVMSGEQFSRVTHALFLLANQLSSQAYLIYRQEQLIRQGRETEEKLRQSEETFKAIFDSINELIFVHDPATGAILDVNRRVCEFYGYTKQEMLALDVGALSSGVAPYDQAHAMEHMRHAVEGRSLSFEWQAKKRDGSLAWLEWTIRRARMGGGDRLLVSGKDISDRKRAQETAQREKAFADAIIDSVPGLLYVYDAQGRLVRWNRMHEELTGYSGEELGRMGLLDWYEGDPEEAGKISKAVARIVEDGYSSVEGNLRHKDGSRRLYFLTGVPLTLEGKSYFTGVGIDITERKRMQELMVQTEKMMSVAGLAAGMAHEINNPLSGILQGLQVLENRLADKTPRNEQIAAACGCTMGAIRAYLEARDLRPIIAGIREAASRAARVVSNMLEFSRRNESARAPHDVRTLLDKAVELCASDYDLKKRYDFRNISVERDYEPGMPPIRCSGTQIEQVFINILKNAAHAMAGAPAGVPPRIVLKAARRGAEAVVEISDNGPGMREDVRNRVFEPFFTTKEPGEGTGLGLSVSYFIVTQTHGGALEVESSPGCGTRFIIHLPLAR